MMGIKPTPDLTQVYANKKEAEIAAQQLTAKAIEDEKRSYKDYEPMVYSVDSIHCLVAGDYIFALGEPMQLQRSPRS
jgi:hypothetical protein